MSQSLAAVVVGVLCMQLGSNLLERLGIERQMIGDQLEGLFSLCEPTAAHRTWSTKAVVLGRLRCTVKRCFLPTGLAGHGPSAAPQSK